MAYEATGKELAELRARLAAFEQPEGELSMPSNIDPIIYLELPEGLREGARLYIEEHIPAGGFLRAVLCNDLIGAVSQADWINKPRLVEIVEWIRDNAPSICWGAVPVYMDWLRRREAPDAV